MATAPDGVIEAIADSDPQRVFIAVQFHPEYVTSLEWSMGIFTYHVDACARYAALPRAELETFRDDVRTWLWHTIRQRFTAGEQESTHIPVHSNGHIEEVKTDALYYPEMAHRATLPA